MNLKEMSLKKQVHYLKSLLKSEESTITGYLAVSAFKHHLISKEHPTAQLKPLLRWYNGQLAKAFIKKYYKEAKETLENFCVIGLLNVRLGQYNGLNEYHLDQSLFPALREALEEVFGKEHIAKVAAGVKYYKFPQDRKGEREGMTNNFSEVKENGNRTDKRRS
jgi:hypothetical protein